MVKHPAHQAISALNEQALPGPDPNRLTPQEEEDFSDITGIDPKTVPVHQAFNALYGTPTRNLKEFAKFKDRSYLPDSLVNPNRIKTLL